MPENCPKYLYINSPNPEFKADTIILIFTDEKLKQESIKYLGVWFQGSSFELLHWAAPPHGPTRMGEVGVVDGGAAAEATCALQHGGFRASSRAVSVFFPVRSTCVTSLSFFMKSSWRPEGLNSNQGHNWKTYFYKIVRERMASKRERVTVRVMTWRASRDHIRKGLISRVKVFELYPPNKGCYWGVVSRGGGERMMMRFAFLARFSWLTLWRRELGEAGVLEPDAVF